MELGMVGLGRMGGNMAARLRAAGHEVVGFDNNPAISDVADLAGLVASLQAPRAVWVMVPGRPSPTRHDALAAVDDPGRYRHRWRELPLHRRRPAGAAPRRPWHRLRRRRRFGWRLG